MQHCFVCWWSTSQVLNKKKDAVTGNTAMSDIEGEEHNFMRDKKGWNTELVR